MPIVGRPLPSPHCPFCASDHHKLVLHARDTTDAFSLSNLLPAGTITIAVHDGEPPCHSASNSEWHSLPLRKPSTYPEGTLFQQLAFLTQHLFLRATCRLGTSRRVIFIRIYLIPNDLSNVCGRLHDRPSGALKKARAYMYSILPLVEQIRGLWDADESSLNAPQKYFLPSHIDNRTMAEIYSDLPSPNLSSSTESSSLCHQVASGGTIWGLRTALYGYQRHSVAVMLERESSTKPVLDPSYIPISCMSETRWYIQPSTLFVLRECPAFSPSRGGLLCEELGTGKTIMIIALALVTASELPQPEESLKERPVLTPLAYNHFPSAEYANARRKAGLGCRTIQQVPSLVELLVHYFSLFKVTSGRPTFADELEASHLWPFIRANIPFYHHYDSELPEEGSKNSRHRNALNLSPQTMYLSSATLVIVPPSLVGQWKTEIDKHCHDRVRYLIVRRSTILPHAKKLASDYELIVMSNARFRTEAASNKTENLYGLLPCTCPYLAGSRVPDCHCPIIPGVTPLLQIRWKRLVIDEGHTTSNAASTLNYFARKLSIQHKWIVTGTPTSNILGLQLGRTTGEHESDDNVGPDESGPGFSNFETPLPTSLDQDNGLQLRIWGSYDSLNLHKLGTMIKDFLAVPRFCKDPKSFAAHVSFPLRDRGGPLPGAIDVLTQVMQMVMVRHRIEDVENDVLLPPMKHDIVYMDLDYYAVKSYNAMQAALAVNAIDSERTGPDYLFHPSKADALQAAISNSSQGLFWSSSDILYNVDQICDYGDEFLATAISRGKEQEELELLQQALKHAAAAANDRTWRAMQPHPDVPFKVSGLDSAIFEAWTRPGLRSPNRTIDIMHPDRLVNLRTVVHKSPLISTSELVEEGNIVDVQEKMSMVPKVKSSREARLTANQMRKMAKEVQGTIDVLKKRIESMDSSDDDDSEECQDKDRTVQATLTEETPACVKRYSPLSGAKVGPSLSTKLNYILSEVQRYSVKEKFLIFSNSPLTLFQVGEAFSLFGIKYLRYTTKEQDLLREQCIMTFETSDVYRVLLIDLKLGARGLNLISASRVIFCEPVWHPDVESQAIKRVHRIGQTRPVTVKTLAIRSTAEEAMIARRRYLRTSDKVPNMTTESGMRQYLQNPHFLSEPTSNDLISVVLSLDDNQVASVGTQPGDDETASIIDVDSEILFCESDGEVPARKKFRFDERL